MKFITAFLLLCFAGANAQYTISGVVIDQETAWPIPFASIRLNNELILADENGLFSVDADGIEQLQVSYVGYQKKTLNINPTKFINIRLRRNLNFVDNKTANSIIEQVFRRKSYNNPLKEKYSYNLKSYTKLLITANPDSVDGRIDTLFYKRPRKGKNFKIDSTDYNFKRIVKKQHLFQTEKVSEVTVVDGKIRENIIGAKMAGFQEPIYEIYGFQLFPFSIYNDPLVIFETPSNSPLSLTGKNQYTYTVVDTLKFGNRHVFAIVFEPRKMSKQTSLQGLLLIDQENHAVAKATIVSKGLINVIYEQTLTYAENQNKYFPEKNSLRIVKGSNEKDIKILGEALKIAASPTGSNSRKHASDHAYLLFESTYLDYEFDQETDKKLNRIAVEISENAIQQPAAFWKKYRNNDSIGRDFNTYKALDSIAQRRGVENKLFIGRKIINGFLPLSFFDVDLRHLISFNNYEGFRIGFGGQTNSKFSKSYRMYGYSTYGTKDGNFKYQLGNAFRLDQNSDTWFGITYSDDVREIASTNFIIDRRSFKIYDPRPINISTFYNYVSWKAQFDTKIFRGTESTWQVSHESVRPLFDYYFNYNDKIYRNFSLSLAVISLQWNPWSDYMQTPNGRLEIVKRFPKFTMQLTKAFPNVLGNELEFGKIEVRTDYERKFINRQKISVLAEAGYAYGQVPITHAYNTSPNNLNKEKIVNRITFAGKDSFETMFFNEFFSDRFAFSQFKYSLDRWNISKQIKPTPVFVTRMVWGDMENKNRHNGLVFKTLDHGFYESGVELNGIFKGLGLSAFYRHGANHLPKFEDNIALKLSFVFNIGF